MREDRRAHVQRRTRRFCVPAHARSLEPSAHRQQVRSGVGGSYAIKVAPSAYRASVHVTYNDKGREAEPLNPPAQHDYRGSGLDILRGGLVRDFVL